MSEVAVTPEALAAAAGEFIASQPPPAAPPLPPSADAACAVVTAATASWPAIAAAMWAQRQASATGIASAAGYTSMDLAAADMDNATMLGATL